MGKRTYVIVFEIEANASASAAGHVREALSRRGLTTSRIDAFEKGTDPISQNEEAISILADSFSLRASLVPHNPRRR